MVSYLNSRPRFEILDGLRGVAAIVVVVFHIFEAYSPGPAYQIINHGYLAVDFFFALSGFVIGYAYDDRWQRGMTASMFLRRRFRASASDGGDGSYIRAPYILRVGR